jgi:iron complex transport system ATP-binding protein
MQPLSELSGGQRQMVGLAQAIVCQPDVLLLDEPTSALDLKHQVHVMDCATTLARGRGTIVIAVLHDVSLALRYADKIAVLNQGEVEAYGRPEDIVTAQMLADTYGIEARIELCSRGRIQMIVDGALP